MNRRNLGFSLAVNHMADYTDAELKIMRGYRSSGGVRSGDVYIPSADTTPPPFINWRIRGKCVCVCVEGYIMSWCRCCDSGEGGYLWQLLEFWNYRHT